MKITRIEPINLANRTLLVKVYTDEGIVGIGECSPMNLPVEIAHLEHSIGPLVLGMDPFNVEALVEKMQVSAYKIAGRTQAMCGAGVEIACWDIMGKALGQPICRLLGGPYRTEVPVYASSMRRDISPEDEARRMYELREKHGFRGGKVRVAVMNGFDQDVYPGRSLAVVRAVREAMGDDFQLMADANSGYSPEMAIVMGRKFEQLGVWHFEEPCLSDDLDGTARVAAALDMAVAGGENDWDIRFFKEMFRKHAVDIVQPDVIKAYGFSHVKKIAAMAGAFNINLVPHTSQHNVGTMANLHFVTATPNCRGLQEFSIEPSPLRDRLFEPTMDVVNGHVRVPDGPGLGITLNEDLIREMRVG